MKKQKMRLARIDVTDVLTGSIFAERLIVGFLIAALFSAGCLYKFCRVKCGRNTGGCVECLTL